VQYPTPLLHTYGVLHPHNTLIPTVETVGYSILLLAEHPPQHPVSAEQSRSKLKGLCYRQTPFRVSRASACRGRLSRLASPPSNQTNQTNQTNLKSPHPQKKLKIYFLTKIGINHHPASQLHQNKLALRQVK
jgi:hypothetical protein